MGTEANGFGEERTPPPPGSPVGPTNPGAATPPVFRWEALAAGQRLVVVQFKDQVYQLRETRNGKLILTK